MGVFPSDLKYIIKVFIRGVRSRIYEDEYDANVAFIFVYSYILY